MTIVDTSVWIDYFKGDQQIKPVIDQLLVGRKVLAISAIFGELFQGVMGKRENRIVNKFWENLPKIDEEDLFVEAGKISNKHKLLSKGIGLIDSYIIAASLRADAEIWTFDKKLQQVILELVIH